MVAVAIVGIMLGSLAAYDRWTIERQRRAEWGAACRLTAHENSIIAASYDFLAVRSLMKPESAKLAPKYLKSRDYHNAIRAKWEIAATRPFVPVAPDPPKPE